MKIKAILATIVVAAATLFSSQDAKAQGFELWYQGEVDLGYSIGIGDLNVNRLNVSTVQGVRVGGFFSAGLSAGVDWYHGDGNSADFFIPVGVNIKGYIPLDNYEPFATVDVGYGISAVEDMNGGLHAGIGVGIMLSAFKIQAGYNVQQVSVFGIPFNLSAVQVKLGVVF